MFSTNDFPDQKAPRRGRRLKIAGATITAGAMAAGGLVVASNAGASGTVWDRVAHCESTGNWSINTGNSFYGGLQFTYDTWKGFGGQKYAYTADRATKAQQIEIAQEVLKVQGPGAWPVCSQRAGLTVSNGLAVDPYSGGTRPSRDTTRPPVTSTGGKLVVDGVQGPRTNAGIEKWGGRPMNGYLDAGDKRALQARVGTAQDGVIGPMTTRALQRKVGADVDGKWGPQTTSRLQTWLNNNVL